MARYEEKRYWGLGALAYCIEWLESFLNTLNGVSLMIGAGIAVTDLLTDGALSRASFWFVYAWAVSQAVGIEVQLLGSFARARQAQRNGSWGALFGWLLLGAILLGATIIAGYTYSVVRAENITTEAALAQLGISNFMFLGIRAILAAGLVALSGWTRYLGKPKMLRSAEDEVALIERQMQIDEAKAKHNRQRAANMAKLARATASAAFNREEEDEVVEDDSPKTSADFSDDEEESAPVKHKGKAPKRIFSMAEARKLRSAKDNGQARSRVFQFLKKYPHASNRDIQDGADVSKGTASKYQREFRERGSSQVG